MEYEPQLEIKQKTKRKNFFNTKIILLIFTIVMFLGISFSAIFYRDDRENYVKSGLISINFVNGSETININNAIPLLDEVGIESDPYIFTVKNTSKVPINISYELEVNEEKTTIPLSAIKYAFYVNGKLISKDTVSSIENNLLYQQNNVKVEESSSAKLVFWVDYYYDGQYKNFSAKIKVTGESFDVIYNMNDSLKSKIDNSICPSSVTDEDGTIYLSGTNDCVNFNYVWYSGKLWRITALYPDGRMKMITQDEITGVFYGADVNYVGSYIYQWLNEDFKDTLYNYEDIIETKETWNATMVAAGAKPEKTTMVESTIGLLNSYEYMESYANIGAYNNATAYGTGYLNIGYRWHLLNPYSAANGFLAEYDGSITNWDRTALTAGVRPAVILKSKVGFVSGNGSKANPYRLDGDKTLGKANEKLNERVSGEYVNFNNQLWRIVDVEDTNGNKITKITSVDYVRDESNNVLKKAFSSATTNLKYGGTGTTEDTYWAGYLNTTWYEAIESPYKEMMVEGTYYLGEVLKGTNYKTSICINASDTVTTKDCEKTSDTWTGYVGLPRVGEMFSIQLGDGMASSVGAYTLTPTDTAVRFSKDWGIFDTSKELTTATYTARPSITLNSNVYITSGEGTQESPYEIAMS